MVGQPEELSCPLCDRGMIQALHIPSATGTKTKSTAAFGKVKLKTRSPDIWLIRSGCSSCGKPLEDVEKELKKRGFI